MKRIWFKTDTIEYNAQFEKELNEDGVEVVFGKSKDPDMEGTLIITDDPEVYGQDESVLVCIESPEEMEKFSEAKYIVMDVWDTENEYFFKIWERLNGIPWTVAVTERIIIRETVEEDLPELIKIYSDPDITRYTEALYEEEDELEYIRQYREKVYELQGFGIWSLIRKEDERLIGRAGLVIRPDYDQVEIGFLIGKELQGKGFAKEAVSECIKIAKKLGFERVRALVMPENIPSAMLLKGLGFEKAGDCIHHGDEYEIFEISTLLW